MNPWQRSLGTRHRYLDLDSDYISWQRLNGEIRDLGTKVETISSGRQENRGISKSLILAAVYLGQEKGFPPLPQSIKRSETELVSSEGFKGVVDWFRRAHRREVSVMAMA